MKRLPLMFTLCLLLFGSLASALTVPVMMSWMEDPHTTMTFSWERPQAGRGTIEYGLTTNYGFSASDSGGYRRHVITVRDLDPGQIYHYKATSTDGFEMDDATFRTAPLSTGSVHFIAYGDNQRGADPQSDHRGVVVDMLTRDADFAINSGDMADEQFNSGFGVWEEFFNVTTDFLAEVVFIPTVGNHENPNDPNSFYWRMFSLPERPANGRYYSRDVGNIHFIALHSEDSIAAQTNWLARDLQAAANDTNITWIVPYFHRPPYTESKHSANDEVRTNWCPLFVQYEADIVFNGHNHSYERTKPIRGITYVITGGGGASLYAVTENPSFHAHATGCYHYIDMLVNGSTMQYEAVRSDGLVFEDLVFTNTGRSVRFSPAFPRRNENVTITYDASRGPIYYSNPIYIYLGIDAFTGSEVDAAMTYNAGTGLWEYDYVVSSDATYRVACVFHDAATTNWDNNYTYNWQALLERVEFDPASPTAGSNVTIRYDAELGNLSGSPQIYAHIGINDWSVLSHPNTPMTYNASDDVWEATVQAPDYADQFDVVFHNGSDWDNNLWLDWHADVQGATAVAPWSPLPLIVPGSPAISSNPPVIQNFAGDNMDFNMAGTPVRSRDVSAGFGDFGEFYFNYDETNLYVGGTGVDMAGTNNVLVLFLGLDTLTDNAENLWHKSDVPNTLDFLHNLAFTEPMDIAIVFGDEYGDDAGATNFTYGGYDFGQGVFYVGTNSADFFPLSGAALSQFDGTGSTACVTTDDDGNRQTDRWEACLPWASLNAPLGVDSVSYILLCGAIGSASVSGNDRYLSSTYVGNLAFGSKDQYGNFGFNMVTLVPTKVLLGDGDYDADGLPNRWEHDSFGSAQGPPPGVDTDHDGMNNGGEYKAGTRPTNAASVLQAELIEPDPTTIVISWPSASNRTYAIHVSEQLTASFQPLATNLPATPSLNSYTGQIDALDSAFYMIEVED